MHRGVFVTATDTNAGKTVVSAAIMHRYRGTGNLRYWKPVQTGIEQDDDTATVAWLGACTADELLLDGVRLRHPVSPHLAAEMAGIRLDLPKIQEPVLRQPSAERRWVVEGAGGVLVPINESEFMVDLITMLRMPVLLVTRSTLGTINHTLLTIEALRNRNLQIAGVVMAGELHPENRKAIEHYGSVAVIAQMPYLPDLTPVTLSDWARAEFDPGGQLAVHLL